MQVRGAGTSGKCGGNIQGLFREILSCRGYRAGKQNPDILAYRTTTTSAALRQALDQDGLVGGDSAGLVQERSLADAAQLGRVGASVVLPQGGAAGQHGAGKAFGG